MGSAPKISSSLSNRSESPESRVQRVLLNSHGGPRMPFECEGPRLTEARPAKQEDPQTSRGDAPRDYGPHKTIYNRIIRWSRLG